MNFADWRNTFQSTVTEVDHLCLEATREWFLGDLLVVIAVHVPVRIWNETGEEPKIHVSISRLVQPTLFAGGYSTTILRDGRRLSGHTEAVTRPFLELTASELRRVADCRGVFEAWMKGLSGVLPIDPPGSAVLLTP